MKIVIDMNLSPSWVALLGNNGFPAVHWSSVGDIRAADATILTWARDNGYTVFTHDLDFGAILAATGSTSPSVIQVRTQDVGPDSLGPLVIAALRNYEAALERGALISIDQSRARARILPLR